MQLEQKIAIEINEALKVIKVIAFKKMLIHYNKTINKTLVIVLKRQCMRHRNLKVMKMINKAFERKIMKAI